ncbi:TetR family transcriptional regulator [Thermosporothrix hazakensis]|jgi:AcrR family transcriptional regulator|uniref:TetR family transcriptional regulator n=1 Tax=Thermosporothrix hazakensis TaxID=644383 RepID=A0A326UCC5_THEHA|nr:TetR/AcrR family transcriptional regulator [Thermosporothrix hazakensis]PZW34309.1 TetR family transcriptional regulator [Thermosporothrix hazakensis]GCE46139.1 hypothetical protein KTH_10080 [Thermosporothrix hazakensis]
MGTKELIIEAAERLFAQHGITSTSLRQITAAARVNLAAVNYHFGTKAALVHVVLKRLLLPLSEQRLQNFASIMAKDTLPTLEEVLHAYYFPWFERFNQQTEAGRLNTQLFNKLIYETDEEIRKSVSEIVAPVTEKYLSLFQQLFPELPEAELIWRFKVMHGVVTTHYISELVPLRVSENTPSEAQSLAWVMTYLTATWQAPATPVVSETRSTLREEQKNR